MHMRKENKPLRHMHGWEGDSDDFTAQIVEEF